MFYFFLFALILNFFFVLFFKKISILINLFDAPDHPRKLHNKPISAIGGVLVFINFSFFLIFSLFTKNEFGYDFSFFSIKDLNFFFIFSIIFFILGFLDDKFKLGPNVKLIFFSFLIYLLIFFSNNILIKILNFSGHLDSINISDISVFFTIFCFLLFINAFNMFDGINGQSALYSLFIFIFFIMNDIFISLSLMLIISLSSFLYLNIKRKCFLGNNGSLLISFIMAYLFLKAYSLKSIFYADQIFLIMAVPGFDLLRLTVQRILNNKHPFHPDKNHLHHLLLRRLGLLKTLVIILTLIIIPNILSFYTKLHFVLIFVTLIIYLFLIYKYSRFKLGKFLYRL